MKKLYPPFSLKALCICLTLAFVGLPLARTVNGQTVSALQATYKDGQVFLTWTCPNKTDRQYNVYRSETKITDTTQLNSTTFIGYVRDSSSKNLRLSQILGGNRFYKIDNSGSSLQASQGLFVTTCTANGSYYYAVMVKKLSNQKEKKKIKLGKNSLKQSVAETIASPKPILQDSTVWNTGDTVKYYAWFGNNIEAPHFPAFCTQGFYGFNFYVIKRGNTAPFPLFAFYEGLKVNSLKGNGLDSFSKVTDCYILGFDDWLPVPNGGDVGENTFWSGYHEQYNFYSEDNPIPTSGIVKMFSQRRYIQSIYWAQKTFPIDTQRTYTVGVSNGGMGAFLTASIIPHKITAVYAVVPVFKLITIDNEDDQPEQMWGDTTTNLFTDILHPETGSPLRVFDLFDTRKMLRVNRNQSMPHYYTVFGKKDMTIYWTPFVPSFFDSLQYHGAGGISFWDQRKHSGSGKNFLDSETMPNWYSLANHRPYPAFAQCSINQNPGNGDPNQGDPFGAINGYLDWVRDSVSDHTCSISLKLFVRDLYVGGALHNVQHNSGTVDVTIRRAQQFKPLPGQTISWTNYDASNTLIQSGTFTYTGGLITIPGVVVNKTKNRLSLHISGCARSGGGPMAEDADNDFHLSVSYSGNTPELVVDAGQALLAHLTIYSSAGQVLLHRQQPLHEGVTILPVQVPTAGTYIAQLTVGRHVRSVVFSVP